MANGRASFVGVPEVFELQAACVLINKAYDGHGHCYHVGSSLERRDYRDVDVRFIMDDEKFCELFDEKPPIIMCPAQVPTHYEAVHGKPFCPECRERTRIKEHYWRFECNARWSLICISISHWLRLRTGLPIDFQIQPQTWANEQYPKHTRNAIGLYVGKE